MSAGRIWPLLVAFATAAFAPFAGAQNWPDKPIKFIVAAPAGSSLDVLARTISDRLKDRLGQPVVVDDRPAAGGTVATDFVAKSPPDGYTMVISFNGPLAFGPHLYAKLPYDPQKDLAAVIITSSQPNVLAVNASLPIQSVKELVDYAKANPGKLNYASAGSGSATHLSMAFLASLAGIEMVHVPYKATNEAVQEVIVGRAHAAMPSTIGALPFARDGRVRLLAVTGAKRSKFLPDLPTIGESGIRDYVFDSWIGLLGPAGIPKQTLESLNVAVGKLLKDPVILDRLDKQGVVPQAMTPAELSALLREDYVKMGKVVKAAGAKID